MSKHNKLVTLFLTLALALAPVFPAAQNLRETAAVKVKAAHHEPGILWVEPRNIASLDLYYGMGGKEHQPAPPFTFLKEDTEGTNPKFDVKDAHGEKWKAKLGIE